MTHLLLSPHCNLGQGRSGVRMVMGKVYMGNMEPSITDVMPERVGEGGNNDEDALNTREWVKNAKRWIQI